MAKLRLILEVEVDEKELQEMTSSQNDYKPLSVSEYVEGMQFNFVEGKMQIVNGVEEYYNINEGNSQCLKNPKLAEVITL